MIKNPPANAGDIREAGSIPGSGRSPAGGQGNPLQYSCLENPMDRGAWWARSTGPQRVRHDWRFSTHALISPSGLGLPSLSPSGLGLPCVECVELVISPRVVAWIGENNAFCAERRQVVQTHEFLPPSDSGLFSSPSLQVAHFGAREVRSPF